MTLSEKLQRLAIGAMIIGGLVTFTVPFIFIGGLIGVGLLIYTTYKLVDDYHVRKQS